MQSQRQTSPLKNFSENTAPTVVHMYSGVKSLYFYRMAGFIVLQHHVQLCRFSIESMTSCPAGILEQQHITTTKTTQKKTS